MRWLIDGYNVIRRDPDLRGREGESLEAGRRALVHLIADLARRSADDFVIVFDGARRGSMPGPAGRVRQVFSRPPETADDVIVRLAGQRRDAAIVVTSDRTVQHAARRARCAVLGAEEFLARSRRDVGDGSVETDEEQDRPTPKAGNPRRLSKQARAAARALRRLPPR